MSHRIIISSKAAPATTTEEHTHGVEYEITYTPSHELTDAQVGAQVAKILKKAQSMGEPDPA